MMADGYLMQNPAYDGLICAMIDARRMEVFTATYDANLSEVEATNAKIVDEISFASVLEKNNITFIGDGAEKCMTVLDHQNAHFSSSNFNSAGNMNALGLKAYQNQVFEDVAYFEPFYLKDFVLTTPKNKQV